MVLVGFPREPIEEGGDSLCYFLFLGEFIGQLGWFGGELPVM
jgi:hypothetical protein